MGVNTEDLPLLLALVPDLREKFNSEISPFDLSVEDIGKFIVDALSKKLAPHVKSEATPEWGEGAVRKVVARSFSDIVLDEYQHVLMHYYDGSFAGEAEPEELQAALQLTDEFYELAEEHDGNSHVVFGSLDVAKNEVALGHEEEGLPALIFYPKDKKVGIVYTGEKNLIDIRAWYEKEMQDAEGRVNKLEDYNHAVS